MRVFVTGAAGFVGRRLLSRLADQGAQAVGVDREVDVTEAAALERAIEGCKPDAIIHLAAVSSVVSSWQDPAATFRVNFLGTRCLLQCAARRAPRARIVLVGSADQYGRGAPGAPPFRETDPQSPRSPYARSKAAAEQLGTLAAAQGFDVVRVRAFNHTGPGQSKDFVASSFAHQIAEIAAGLRAPQLRVGNLDSVRDFLDVDDVVGAYLALLDPTVPAGIYNVASGGGVAIQELLDQLIELAGVSPVVEVDSELYRPTDQLIGDASRLHDATGWRPRTPLRSTLTALLADWRKRVSEGPLRPSGA